MQAATGEAMASALGLSALNIPQRLRSLLNVATLRRFPRMRERSFSKFQQLRNPSETARRLAALGRDATKPRRRDRGKKLGLCQSRRLPGPARFLKQSLKRLEPSPPEVDSGAVSVDEIKDSFL